MDYDKSKQTAFIQRDIFRSTYSYFRQCDRIFTDYIYGDPYYQTLCDLIYSFLGRWQIDYSIDCQCLGLIDVVQLVSDLYAVFIKADVKVKEHKAMLSERYRKNYIHKALRNATWKLLHKQLQRYIIIKDQQSDIEKVLNDNLRSFRYVSFDVYEEDNFVDQISYERWVAESEIVRDRERKTDVIKEMSSILSASEAQIIDLTLEGWHFSDMAETLKLEVEQVRKIFHRAKNKLTNHYQITRR